nr:glycoside hydrolase family 95 protein [Planctomycetota bacterium]
MDTALWYRLPVTEWDQAMPIGNGRLGGMIFGGTARERIQLNENSLWAGGPRTWDNPRAFSHLAEVRALLTAGRPVEAMALADRHLMAEPLRLSPYQPLGDALLGFAGHERADAYRRELDLDQALVTVSYRVDGVAFRREYFASAVDEVLVVRLTADRPGALSFTTELR